MLCNILSLRNPPLRTTVILNGREVVMEVDIGAAVSVISEEAYRQTWKITHLPCSHQQLS